MAVFGLATAPDGSLLVADTTNGIVQLRKERAASSRPLPGAVDIAAIGRGSMFAVTGGGEPGPNVASLFAVSKGSTLGSPISAPSKPG